MYAVIIPVYNGSGFIKDTLTSIVNQEIKPKRIIIVDDCSSDNTVLVLRDFKDSCDDRIEFKILSTESVSGSAALPRNIGMKHVYDMKYVAFCDADDIWHSDKISKQISILEKEDCDAVYTEVIKFSGDNYLSTESNNLTSKKIYVSDFRFNNPVKSCSSMLLKKHSCKNILFPTGKEYRGVEDYYAWIGLYSTKPDFKLKMICGPLVGYRQHNESISNSKLSMSKLRLRTYKYKSGIIKSMGLRMPGRYISELIYIIKQLVA